MCLLDHLQSTADKPLLNNFRLLINVVDQNVKKRKRKEVSRAVTLCAIMQFEILATCQTTRARVSRMKLARETTAAIRVHRTER